MAIRSIMWCDECGIQLADESAAKAHEKSDCMPYAVGDRVEFGYHLITTVGEIYQLGNLVSAGETRIAWIRSDTKIFDSNLSDGHDVCIQVTSIIKKVPSPQTA